MVQHLPRGLKTFGNCCGLHQNYGDTRIVHALSQCVQLALRGWPVVLEGTRKADSLSGCVQAQMSASGGEMEEARQQLEAKCSEVRSLAAARDGAAADARRVSQLLEAREQDVFSSHTDVERASNAAEELKHLLLLKSDEGVALRAQVRSKSDCAEPLSLSVLLQVTLAVPNHSNRFRVSAVQRGHLREGRR